MWSVRISIVRVWRIRNTGTPSLPSILWTQRVSIQLIADYLSLSYLWRRHIYSFFSGFERRSFEFFLLTLTVHEHWELFIECWDLFFTDIIKELEKNGKLIKDVSHSQELLKKNLRYNCKEILMYSSTSNEVYIVMSFIPYQEVPMWKASSRWSTKVKFWVLKVFKYLS